MNRNPAEMTAYASLYPGVDHHPNASDHPRWHQHLYTCRGCGQATIPPRLVTTTDRGGIYTVPPRCDLCLGLEREPQGESMRLFEPAPHQIPGQLGFAG